MPEKNSMAMKKETFFLPLSLEAEEEKKVFPEDQTVLREMNGSGGTDHTPVSGIPSSCRTFMIPRLKELP